MGPDFDEPIHALGSVPELNVTRGIIVLFRFLHVHSESHFLAVGVERLICLNFVWNHGVV